MCLSAYPFLVKGSVQMKFRNLCAQMVKSELAVTKLNGINIGRVFTDILQKELESTDQGKRYQVIVRTVTRENTCSKSSMSRNNFWSLLLNLCQTFNISSLRNEEPAPLVVDSDREGILRSVDVKKPTTLLATWVSGGPGTIIFQHPSS